MIGVAVFLAIPILYLIGQRLRDRGISERRRIRKHYYTMFVPAMAEFEAGGGRVQEIDDATGAARKLQVPVIYVAPLVLGLIVPVLLTWAGLPLWVSGLPMCAFIGIAGAHQWLLSDLLGMVDGAPPTSRRAATAAVGTLTLKCTLVMAGILTVGEGISRVNTGDWTMGLVLDVAGFALLTYCYLPVELLERWVRRRDEVAFAGHAKTDAMLYLRSFADDELRLYSPFGRLGPGFRFIPGRIPFERLMTACLTDRSGLLGVGRPDERLPMLGAQRTYWPHDAWQEAIRTTATRVDGLLVLAGRTPSLSWEMGQLASLGLLGKTLILFPPDGQEATLERYRYVATALHFPEAQQLPDHLKVALTAIAFDEGDQPVHYMSGGRDWSSYLGTVIHFAAVQDGDIKLESEGSVLESVKASDDPFVQARYLVDAGDRNRAQSILASVDPNLTDSATMVGRAWELAAIRENLPAARQLLIDASESNHDPMLDRALTALDAIETGPGETAGILRARFPDRFQPRHNHVRIGRMRLPLRKVAKFMTAAAQWDAAEDSRVLQDVVDAAEAMSRADGGIETLQAYIQGRLGHAYLEAGRTAEEATEYLDPAASLIGAPRVTISDAFPVIDPADVVDTALCDLCTIAARSGNHEAELAALLRLRQFRAENVSVAKSAKTARDIAVACVNGHRYDEAFRWAEIAAHEYHSVGQPVQAAESDLVATHIHTRNGSADVALAMATRAFDVAETAHNTRLQVSATFEIAWAEIALGRPQDAWLRLEQVLPLAADVRPWIARATVIAMSTIDPVAAAPHAADLSIRKPDFYGPSTAEILNQAAAVVDDDDTRIAVWSRRAMELLVPKLPEAQAFRDLGTTLVRLSTIGALDDDDISALTTRLSQIRPIELLSPASDRFTASLENAGLFEPLALVEATVVDVLRTYINTGEPSHDELHRILTRMERLSFALRRTSHIEDSLAISAELINLVRSVDPARPDDRETLASALVNRGRTLMKAERYNEAIPIQQEAITILRDLVSEGVSVEKHLVSILLDSAENARVTGSAAEQRRFLTEADEVLTSLDADSDRGEEAFESFTRDRQAIDEALEGPPAVPESGAAGSGGEERHDSGR